MKKIYTIITLVLLSGCTQVVTAPPLKITGAVVSTTIDVAGSAAGAVAGSNDECED